MTRPLNGSGSFLDNVDAWRLGNIAANAGHPGRSGVGDSIDRGLILAQLLAEYGYELRKIEGAEHKSTLDLKTPLMPTWPGWCAMVALHYEDGRDALEGQGWKKV